ncbi:hypothetical protein [Flagellimonas abyssi]|uniref:hypothetical protein n=1 Tax=Flagellimonas abyssi TaxID=2864871 RepID=UPI001C67C057|nr:hypothetical protein [Allomuricauda abyssi]|tara:strand:- start:247 stop:456 length:210 start_codon:yes stop_codon:yes gene_type:complete
MEYNLVVPTKNDLAEHFKQLGLSSYDQHLTQGGGHEDINWMSRMVKTTKNGKFEPSNIWIFQIENQSFT